MIDRTGVAAAQNRHVLGGNMMRLGLVQMLCEKNAVADNLDTISRYIAEAAARRVDIIAFPEMCLTGYVDLIKYPGAALRLDGPEVSELLELTRGYTGSVLVGLTEFNPAGKPFITHIVVRNGLMLGFSRKITIVGEETDWFSPGSSVPVFRHDALTFSIAICADLTNEDVFAQGSRQGARVIFEVAAPGLYGEQETPRNWESGYAWWSGECQKYLSSHAKKFGIWILVATQAGRAIDEDFPGGGFVFAPNGERVFATTDWSPGAVFLEIDFDTGCVTQIPGN